MNRKTGRSLPPTEHITNSIRQKGAFVDLSKGLTAVKDRHFDSRNEQLQFAKYVNKFDARKCKPPPQVQKDPISQTHMDFHTELKRIKKGSPLYNLTTMTFRPSKDEIIQKKNRGEFHDLNRTGDKLWKPSVRLVDEYVRRKRFDDADLRRGQKYIPDKNYKRNPLVDGDMDVEEKPVKVRYPVEPSEELKDMNRKKLWGQYDSKFAPERAQYEAQRAVDQSAAEDKALTGRIKGRNENAAQLNRGDSMKDLLVYKFADQYRDVPIAIKPNRLSTETINQAREQNSRDNSITNFRRSTDVTRWSNNVKQTKG